MPKHFRLSSYNRFENDMKHFVFYLNKAQGMYRESCMLTDKSIFKNKIIQC